MNHWLIAPLVLPLVTGVVLLRRFWRRQDLRRNLTLTALAPRVFFPCVEQRGHCFA